MKKEWKAIRKDQAYFFKKSNVCTNVKNIFIDVQSLMGKLDAAEERNSELENKAGKIIQNAAKEIKTRKKVYKTWKMEWRFNIQLISIPERENRENEGEATLKVIIP